jgi:hypothetical protein
MRNKWNNSKKKNSVSRSKGRKKKRLRKVKK